MRIMTIGFVGLCLLVADLGAQQYPFSKGPLSQTEGALAIELGQVERFHVDLDSFVVAMNLMFSDLKLEHRTDLARHLRTLKEYDCREVARGQQIPYARTQEMAMIDLSGVWQRDCRPDEKLLCSEERCEISTWCWNIVVGQFAPSRPAPAPRQPAFPVNPIVRAVPTDTVIRYVDREVEVPVQQSSEPGWFSRNWKWVTPSAAGVIGGLIWWALESGGDILNVNRNHR